MRTRDLSELRKLLVMHAPNVALPVLDQAIIQSVREFLHETRIWQCELDPFTLRADRAVYDLDGWPSWARLDAVVRVDLQTTTLRPGTDFDFIESETAIRLLTTPSGEVADGLLVTVALTLPVDGTKLPERLFDDHAEAFAEGAKWRLLKTQGKTYTNPGAAQEAYAQFWKHITDARLKMLRGGRIDKPLRATARTPFY
jgi:hypothetical protein